MPYIWKTYFCMTTPKPQTIAVKGVDIRTTVIDEKDDIVKHTQIFYMKQFNDFANQYVDHNGVFRMEIVKRRTQSPQGHEHWMRVASTLTNPCITSGVIPK